MDLHYNHGKLLRKLSSLGSNLPNLSLMKQTKILDQLIYKYRNQHGREKYFKCLKMIKKCLVQWELLSLNGKLTVKALNTSLDSMSALTPLEDLLIALQNGGMIVIRNIVLCQEAVQYSIGFLQLGFFVTLHVTLFALISRIWILLKDCWTTLVECYKLARLVFKFQADQHLLDQFPECLTLMLKDELQGVYTNNVSDQFMNNLDLTTNMSKHITQEDGYKDVNGSAASKDDELDLGEPVQDFSRIRLCDDFDLRTPTSSKGGVSSMTRKLTLTFDEDICDDGTDSDCSVKLENVNKEANNFDKKQTVHGTVSSRKFFPKVRRLGSFFAPKSNSRHPFRMLASTDIYYRLTSREMHGLLAIINYLLRLVSPGVNRKVLFKARRNLRNRLKAREFSRTMYVKNRSRRKRSYKNLDSELTEKAQTGNVGETEKLSLKKLPSGKYESESGGPVKKISCNDIFNLVKSSSKVPQDCNANSNRTTTVDRHNQMDTNCDEIDDIFSSLGF